MTKSDGSRRHIHMSPHLSIRVVPTHLCDTTNEASSAVILCPSARQTQAAMVRMNSVLTLMVPSAAATQSQRCECLTAISLITPSVPSTPSNDEHCTKNSLSIAVALTYKFGL